MAERLGVSVQYLRLLEEAADLSVGTLNQCAAALQVPVSELVVEPPEWANSNYLAKDERNNCSALAAKLRDQSRRRAVQRLAQTFLDQLKELLSALAPMSGVKHHHRRKPNGHWPSMRQGNGGHLNEEPDGPLQT